MPPENQNPIQKEYDQELGPDFSPLAQAEQDGTADDSSNEGVKNAEENPNWRNNVTGTGGGGRGKNTSSTAGGMGNKAVGNNTGPFNSKLNFSVLRKRSPLITIILLLAGGGIGIGGLLSPGLLIVQMKEVMVNKFDNQLTSMTSREVKLYAQKMTGKITGGVCNSPVSILCKYSSMSEKEVANFEKAGIHVVSDGDKTLLGRIKPKSFEFNGEKIPAKNFTKKMISDTEFRSAVHQSYNSKFAGFADADWVKAEADLGISKKAADLEGETDDEMLKSVQDDTKNPAPQDETTTERVKPGDPKPGGGTYDDTSAAAANAAADEAKKAADEIASGAAKAAEDATKAAPGALESSLGTAANAVSITGWLNNACGAYGAIQAVGYAAKTVRALQLARYAMIFLNVADQIKAGTAKPKDVAYLGTVLTTQFIAKDKHGNILSKKSATDSFGYQFAAYGKGGKMSNTATQFLAGGGLTGDMIKITSEINNVLFGSPRKTCKVVTNPFVNIGSLVGGIALFFVPGVDIEVSAWDVAKGALQVGLQIAEAYAPALLKDIVAGVLVDKSTVGEAAGDAMTSGASGIMSTTAKFGGNAPLTPSDAVSYSNLSSNVAEQYAQEDRLAYSPLDATNSNTFMGKIVGQLIPYASNMSSLSGALSSMASVVTGSFASLTGQTAKAVSTDDYTMCQDYDYRDLNLATDPYCNVTYGIPPDALNADPITVAQTLLNETQTVDDGVSVGQIDPETGDPVDGTNYAKFVENCMDRTEPLGADSNGSTGSECLFGKDFNGTPNNNYYIHYIDQRVQMGLDGDEVAGQGTPSETDSGSSGIDPSEFDNSNQSCSDGTKDLGVVKTKYSGSLVQTKYPTIRLCQLSSISGVGANSNGAIISGGAIVNAAVSGAFQQLGEKALSQNPKVQLTATSSFRLFDSCGGSGDGSSCATPGASPHQIGIAIDFGLSDGHTGTSTTSCSARATSNDPQWEFLHEYAASFGIKQYTYENWHWDASGMSNRCA